MTALLRAAKWLVSSRPLLYLATCWCWGFVGGLWVWRLPTPAAGWIAAAVLVALSLLVARWIVGTPAREAERR